MENPRVHLVAVPALLSVAAVLAVTSLVTDSVTFDETSHLTAGFSYLHAGDFRLAPDHPPLAKLWAAWPLLLVRPRWPAADEPAWRAADVYSLGRRWLFELNDGQRLVVIGRIAMVIALLATCLTTYALARVLFGRAAALLALVLAALSPTMLAHGRLVTTDMPIALCSTLTLLAFAHLLRRPTVFRLLAAAVALAAASVTKFSWPLIVPALAAMTVVMIVGRSSGVPGGWSRRRWLLASLGAIGLVVVVVWAGIWTCYGWRYSITAPLPAARDTPEGRAALHEATSQVAIDWANAIDFLRNEQHSRLTPALLEAAHDGHWLPEAYLLGLAQTFQYTATRSAYLMGQLSQTGWRTYFPIAAAIKTPLPTLLLLGAGIWAAVRTRIAIRQAALSAGLVVFAAVYAMYLVTGHLDIGHRHLLPLYPVLFIFAGASAAWLTRRWGQVFIGVAGAWLLVANLRAHPHYLAYFNELVGGPARGYEYLADSNVDWGQDLMRLAEYARRHPDEPIKLAYFGSALPTFYLACTALPSYLPFEPRAKLDTGTYVVSVTQLLGVYDRGLRPDYWSADMQGRYADWFRLARQTPVSDEPQELHARRAEATRYLAELAPRRLIYRLHTRPPDARVGWSLLVYRLSTAQVEELVRP